MIVFFFSIELFMHGADVKDHISRYRSRVITRILLLNYREGSKNDKKKNRYNVMRFWYYEMQKSRCYHDMLRDQFRRRRFSTQYRFPTVFFFPQLMKRWNRRIKRKGYTRLIHEQDIYTYCSKMIMIFCNSESEVWETMRLSYVFLKTIVSRCILPISGSWVCNNEVSTQSKIT